MDENMETLKREHGHMDEDMATWTKTRVAEPENLKTVPAPTFYLVTVPVPVPAPVPGHVHAYTCIYLHM